PELKFVLAVGAEALDDSIDHLRARQHVTESHKAVADMMSGPRPRAAASMRARIALAVDDRDLPELMFRIVGFKRFHDSDRAQALSKHLQREQVVAAVDVGLGLADADSMADAFTTAACSDGKGGDAKAQTARLRAAGDDREGHVTALPAGSP